MKKVVLIMLLALPLGGCFQTIGTVGSLLGPGVSVPITRAQVDTLNASWGAALTIADGYRDACAARLIASSCRTIVQRMQAAARPIHERVKRVRLLARNPNPTVNLSDVIREVSDAVNDFKVWQMERGVR